MANSLSHEAYPTPLPQAGQRTAETWGQGRSPTAVHAQDTTGQQVLGKAEMKLSPRPPRSTLRALS